MKKLVVGLLVIYSALILGCKSECHKSIGFSAFNDEKYVWQDYQFSTNQVQEVK